MTGFTTGGCPSTPEEAEALLKEVSLSLKPDNTTAPMLDERRTPVELGSSLVEPHRDSSNDIFNDSPLNIPSESGTGDSSDQGPYPDSGGCCFSFGVGASKE